jgi:DNA-binding transcriptional LysR family regulator/sugar lactone lactonase YvrE
MFVARTILLLALAGPGFAQTYTITTLAGGSVPPTPGAATGTPIGAPTGVAADSSGNVYFASLHCVFKVDKDGTLTRVAGNGRPGYSGDGAPATDAQLYNPAAVAVDAGGTLYIADSGNNRIRKVSPDGIISTYAGGGPSLGDGGPASRAYLISPRGLATDAAGNLYIADTYNSRIRKVSESGIITTVAGNGGYGYSGDGGPATSAQLAVPAGVVLDSSGSLYIAEVNNNCIRRVAAGGVITTFAGTGRAGYSGDGGPATAANLYSPWGVATDASGNLYIADSNNNRIRKVSPGGTITSVAGNGYGRFLGDGGPATSAQFSVPFGVAVDRSGNLYIGDYFNHRIRKVKVDGTIATVAGNGAGLSDDGTPATAAQVYDPEGVAADRFGNVYVAEAGNHRIRKISPAGAITTVAGDGSYGYSGDGSPATSAQLYNPHAVAVDASGTLYIADSFNYRIRMVSPGGVISTIAGTGRYGFSGDGGPATSAQISLPMSVSVDAAGNLYLADQANHRIRKVTPGGVISNVAGNGSSGYSGDGGPATAAQLYYPQSVAADASGNLFIADMYNHRIRKISTAGIITTVAGAGTPGYSGLQSMVALAELGSLAAVAEKLHLSPAAIHQQLRALETSLGVRLYERVGRRLKMTRAAELLLPYCCEMLAQRDAALTALAEWKGLKRGIVRIGAGPTLSSYLLPALLRKFRRAFPGVDLYIETGNSAGLIEGLGNGRFDLALLVSSQSPEGPNLQVEASWEVEYVLVSNLRNAPRQCPMAALRQFPFILYSKGSRIEDLIERYFAEINFHPKVIMTFDNGEAIKAMIRTGLGVAMLPMWIVDADLKRGSLALIRQRERRLLSKVELTSRKSNYVPSAVQAFVELARTFQFRTPRLISQPGSGEPGKPLRNVRLQESSPA